jgi:hypothetical protein
VEVVDAPRKLRVVSLDAFELQIMPMCARESLDAG